MAGHCTKQHRNEGDVSIPNTYLPGGPNALVSDCKLPLTWKEDPSWKREICRKITLKKTPKVKSSIEIKRLGKPVKLVNSSNTTDMQFVSSLVYSTVVSTYLKLAYLQLRSIWNQIPFPLDLTGISLLFTTVYLKLGFLESQLFSNYCIFLSPWYKKSVISRTSLKTCSLK